MDFILSIAVFISVLLTVVTVWGTVDTQIKDLENRRDLQTISIAVSDSLVRSPGNPENWASSNVQSIGLASEERVISLGKVLTLLDMNYDTAKGFMRLGGLTREPYGTNAVYDFELMFADKDGYNLSTGIARSPVAYYARDPNRAKLLGKINASELTWDFYWGNNPGNLPGGASPGAYTRRYFYPSNAIKRFNTMVANQTSYRTIIIESMDVHELSGDNSDLNISGLQEFVRRGGILVVMGQGNKGANIIDQNFSMHGDYAVAGWGNGNATGPGYFMPNTQVGEKLTFANDHWIFRSLPDDDAELNVIVSREGEPVQGMACWWYYGYGKVYYFEDLDGATQSGLQLADEFAIIGRPMKFGLSPYLQSHLVSVRRTVLLEGMDRELAVMVLRVWK